MKALAKRILHSGLPVPGWLRPLIRALYRAGVWGVEAAALARKVLWVEPVVRSVCRSVGRGFRAERLPYIRGRGALALGDRVNLSGRSCFYFIHGMPEAPEITIGDDVFIGHGCTLSAARRIRIGARCLVSAGVRIHDNDGHPLDPERRRAGRPIAPEDAAPVELGANVWIGACAIILKGVTVGENSVVGAGAVVAQDVPPNTVVAGNPARAVRSLEPPAAP